MAWNSVHDATHRYPRSAAAHHASTAAAARKTQRRSPIALLADPRVRLGLGTAAVLVTALPARRNRVGHCEAGAFRAVNGLPDSLYVPAWVIMQLGTLGAVPAAAGAALLAHDRDLAGRLLAGGAGTWALSKLVKQMVRRPRPATLVSGTRTRGRDASGLGYLSGHAGVAVALGTAAFPRLSPPGRAVVAAAVPVVGLSRVYVGAHLPLDVAGGAALGLAAGAAVTLVRHPAAMRNRPDVLPTRIRHVGLTGLVALRNCWPSRRGLSAALMAAGRQHTRAARASNG